MNKLLKAMVGMMLFWGSVASAAGVGDMTVEGGIFVPNISTQTAGDPVCIDTGSGKLVAGCDGAVGPAGPAGPPGLAGSPCSVSDDGTGTATISCPGGSSVSFAIPYCGNSIVEAGEECDAGSDTATCQSCMKVPNFPNSAIITQEQGAFISENWLGLPNQGWIRCYQKSVDGGVAAFHANCDNKGPTVMVAQLNAGTVQNRIIGGYADESWTSSSSYKGTASNFLFSLTTNFKHIAIAAGNYQYDHASYGPTFGGGHDFYTNLASSSYCNIGYSYSCRVGSYTSTECREDFCGQYTPVIDELEVWYKAP